MTDTKGKGVTETLAEEAKGLAREAYGDVARPILTPIGRTAGTAVEVLLAPVDLILGGLKAGTDRLKARLGARLADVPPDRLLAPPATIGAPSALHYALLGDGDEVADLRVMFENLLVTSMDRETATQAHPAFAGMIGQITPDEAWILKSIDRRRYALVTLFERDTDGATMTQSRLGFRTLLGLGTGIDESRHQQYPRTWSGSGS